MLDNGVEGLVLPYPVAIGSEDGTAMLRVASQIGTHALTARPQRKDPTVTVQALTLDSFVRTAAVDVAAVRLVKVDVQGWEGHVLLGASSLLPCRPIVWQLEIDPDRIKKSGLDPHAVFARLGEVFGWCFALDADAGSGLRPARETADVIARARRNGRTYVDILFGHGDVD